MAKDFTGKEIKRGYAVVFVKTGKRELQEGFVSKITPYKVLIAFGKDEYTYRYHNDVILLGVI